MFSSNSVIPDARQSGSDVSDTDEINNSVSDLESVISKTIENNKNLQEVAKETGTQQMHIDSHASDIDIVPLVETVPDDERIEIANRKPPSGDTDENIEQSKGAQDNAYVSGTVSTTESEIKITNDTRFEIATEMVTELSLLPIGTEKTADSNMQVVSTTETSLQQVRIFLHRIIAHLTVNLKFIKGVFYIHSI